MHKIKPEVYYQRINKTSYQVKLKKGNNEFVITEYLKDGLPEKVTLEHNGETKILKSVYEAELEANKIMGDKDGRNFTGV